MNKDDVILVVEIERSAYDQLFYSGAIGKVFVVKPHATDNTMYQVVDAEMNPIEGRTIFRRDAKVVNASDDNAIMSENMREFFGG